MSQFYEADFETTTSKYNKNMSKVWLYYMENIWDEDDNDLNISIDHFFSTLEKFRKPTTIFFHNLDFDGDFIKNWLVDYKTYVRPSEKAYTIHLDPNQWTEMSAGVSETYKIRYCNSLGVNITFKDSLKLLNESVSSLMNVTEKKKIDYDIVDLPHSVKDLTPWQKEYVKKDVKTVIPYMRHLWESMGKNGVKLTAASTAQAYLKKSIGKDNFDFYFTGKIKPGILSWDKKTYWEGEWDYLSRYLVGGYCRIGNGKKNRLIHSDNGSIYRLDVNSLYSKAMRDYPMPYGFPIYNCKDKDCNHIKLLEVDLDAKIKPGHVGFIPSTLKSNFINVQWLDEVHQVCYFTDLMWDRVKKYYDIEYFHINKEIHFKWKIGIYTEEIDHWMNMKKTAERGSPDYHLAKLNMNSPYGKTIMNPLRKTEYLRPATKKDMESAVHKYGILKKMVYDYTFTLTEPQYNPTGIFVTSYAKTITIDCTEAGNMCTHCLPNGERGYLYSDTDSVHALLCDECFKKLSKLIKIDDKELGAFKIEAKKKYFIAFARKKYIEFDNLEEFDRDTGFAGVDKIHLGIYTNEEIADGFVHSTRCALYNKEVLVKGDPIKFWKRMKRKVAGGIILEDKRVHIHE